MRRLVRETRISAEEMIYPIFVIEGENIKNPIPSMPGVFQYSVDRMDEMLAEVAASGISGVLIFGIPKEKDAVGSQLRIPGRRNAGQLMVLRIRVPGQHHPSGDKLSV